jgi:hypothetical protein
LVGFVVSRDKVSLVLLRIICNVIFGQGKPRPIIVGRTITRSIIITRGKVAIRANILFQIYTSSCITGRRNYGKNWSTVGKSSINDDSSFLVCQLLMSCYSCFTIGDVATSVFERDGIKY